MIARFLILCLAALGFLPAVAASAEPTIAATLPAPAGRKVDFLTEVKPILEKKCANCHGYGRDKGGFQLDDRAMLLKGGDSGPAVEPGKSGESLLIRLVGGLDPDNLMPKKGSPLTSEQVALLRAWIDQGLAWNETVSFAKKPPANLKRQPVFTGGGILTAPPLGASANPNAVNSILQAYFRTNQVESGKRVDDRTFARRASLDVIGLLPEPDQLEAFVADQGPDKRLKFVRRLLSDNEAYAEHWLSFWNDLLRNDYRGTGYIDGGRKQITGWVYNALLTNMPYDKFAARLIDPIPESEGFTKGIIWRGVVNASQTPEMQAAQNVSQVFMGVNIKCASCHDSFVNQWRLSDAYGLAAIYAEGPLEMFECDKPTGRNATARFIYPEVGEIDPKADRNAKRKRLAEILTSPEDGRLSRTVVNRLWAKFLGRGLVEPVDDMEQRAWCTPLLDWLAEDLVAGGYNLKLTVERIVTSDAYQLAAVNSAERGPSKYVFRGPEIRRMSAEQFRDAVGQLTGVWHERGELPTARTNQVRASLVAADALASALGRPNREQVVTVRSADATTLQALELMNGRTLSEVLDRGAARLASSAASAEDTALLVYRRGLGRAPSAQEKTAAVEILGQPVTKEGMADLLWAVALQPEFQLIY